MFYNTCAQIPSLKVKRNLRKIADQDNVFFATFILMKSKFTVVGKMCG